MIIFTGSPDGIKVKASTCDYCHKETKLIHLKEVRSLNLCNNCIRRML